ncbi:Conserved hypothetical protein [gamma proteobacterium HdN1]|nr:Conserved hypothetical protein [gamma proteobacterium HdN1]
MINVENSRFVRACEAAVFNHRGLYVVAFVVCSLLFGYFAAHLRMDSSLEKMVPMHHEYIQNWFKHKDDLSLGNDLRIAVETTGDDIFNKDYLETLRKITDEVHYLEGVDKSKIQSLWTPNVRWVEVTEEGFIGGEVIPPDYDGSPESLKQVQANVLRSGQVGRLVGDNFKSSIVYVPLIYRDESKGEKHDYRALSHQLEKEIRDKYQSDTIKIHIVGFGKKIGDMMDGAIEVALFFLIGVGITFLFLWIDTRCLRSTLIVIFTSVTAVVWQLGIITMLGYGLDPYSMLVPFLIFAIAVSHSVQIVQSFADAKADGHDNVLAARMVFRSLFAAGASALICDAIGFYTLYIIDIRVIKELSIAAGAGTMVVTFTNLILVKVLFSYTGVSQAAINQVLKKRQKPQVAWKLLSRFANPAIAAVSIVVAAILGVGAFYISKDLKTGDLDPGAPELRPNSRYNLDDRYVNANYSISADVLVVMVETPPDQCSTYDALEAIDRFTWYIENVKGVQSAVSLVTVSKRVAVGYNEGNLKWQELSRIPDILNSTVKELPAGLMNTNCTLVPVIVFLKDHKAETLRRTTRAVETFAADNDNPAIAKFVLASGNAGVEAATNQTVERAASTMMWLVYSVVALMCWITFRFSIAAVVCVITPLILTSILCEALMTLLGMGLKVGTLPVIALGVGIGVDYGIYIYSRMQEFLDLGQTLEEAYFNTLCVTGKAVTFTAVSLAVGVGTWIFSAIKFQADMGILLTFMFVWNMVGAMWLLPAIADLLVKVKLKKLPVHQNKSA